MVREKGGCNLSTIQILAGPFAQFMFQAIENERRGAGMLHGYSIDAYAPKVGDILQNNRGKNHFDFSFAATHKAYESHSAIAMEAGMNTKENYLRTIGGNESDSVGLKEVRLDKTGHVVKPAGIYISVLEALL